MSFAFLLLDAEKRGEELMKKKQSWINNYLSEEHFYIFFLCDSELTEEGWLLGGEGVILTAKGMKSQIFDVGLLCVESN